MNSFQRGGADRLFRGRPGLSRGRSGPGCRLLAVRPDPQASLRGAYLPGMQIRLRPLIGALVLALTACGGADLPRAERAVSTGLAEQADALAAALEAGDGCSVDEHAESLIADARSAVEEGRADAEVASEVEAVVVEITEGVTCEPPPSEPPEDEDEEDEDEEKDDEEESDDHPGKGLGRGKHDD